jgi:hypothetical protein
MYGPEENVMVFVLCIYRVWKSEISSRTETVVNMDIYECESGMGNITLEQVTKAQRVSRCIATPFL